MENVNNFNTVVLLISSKNKNDVDKLSIVIEKIIEQHYPQYFCVKVDQILGHSDKLPKYEKLISADQSKTLFIIIHCYSYPDCDYGYRVCLDDKNSEDPNAVPLSILYKDDPQSLAEIALVCIENSIEKTNPTVCTDLSVFDSLQQFNLTE
jgi:hypothetical protein